MKHPDRPFLVAITGGIASGKSIASKWFEEHDFKVIYADKIGHKLFKEQNVKNQIEVIFGKEVIVQNQVDRAKLGQIIFNSPAKRKQLDELLHPVIRKRMQLIIANSSDKILIFEIPLLFENRLHTVFDFTINISAKKDLRIKRIVARDGITRESAQKRIDSQMPENEKQKLADINIDNDEDVDTLFLQLNQLLELIRKSEKKAVKSLLDL